MNDPKNATPMTPDAATAAATMAKYCPKCHGHLQYKQGDPCTCGTRISFGDDSGTLSVPTPEKL